MKVVLLAVSLLLFIWDAANAEWVGGYTRRDGTYVPGYNRTDRDASRDNNYGPGSTADRYSPQTRDYDRDGIPNRYDTNDDNDAKSDNQDRYPYNKRRW